MDLRKKLSRRERQIMDGLYRLGHGTVTQVKDQMVDPPGYDAVRTTLRILEDKGFVQHRRDGRQYVYSPAIQKQAARRLALADLVRTFFDGSAAAAAAALLKLDEDEAGELELERLRERIAQAEETPSTSEEREG